MTLGELCPPQLSQNVSQQVMYRFYSRLLIVAVSVAISFSCKPLARPELSTTVADLLAEIAFDAKGATVLLDQECFQGGPELMDALPRLQELLRDGGIESEFRALEACSAGDLAAEGYIVLFADLNASGPWAELFAYSDCGIDCGRTTTYKLQWRDGAWSHEVVDTRLHEQAG